MDADGLNYVDTCAPSPKSSPAESRTNSPSDSEHLDAISSRADRSQGENSTSELRRERSSLLLERRPTLPPVEEPELDVDRRDYNSDATSSGDHISRNQNQSTSSIPQWENEAKTNYKVSTADFHPFLEFPTPQLLTEANNQYKNLGLTPPRNKDGELLPYPTTVKKSKVFVLDEYAALDERACTASMEYLTKPIAELVDYLIDPYETELQRVRSIYRWITAQNPNDLTEDDSITDVATPNTPLEFFYGIKNETSSYNLLMESMCKHAKLRTFSIKGLLKGSKYEPGDNISETTLSGYWLAVAINNTWHLINAHWSSKHVSGDDFLDWQLLDDNGDGVKKMERKKKKVPTATLR